MISSSSPVSASTRSRKASPFSAARAASVAISRVVADIAGLQLCSADFPGPRSSGPCASLRQTAGRTEPLTEPHDARKGIDDTELARTGRLRNQQAAIVGAEVKRRIKRRAQIGAIGKGLTIAPPLRAVRALGRPLLDPYIGSRRLRRLRPCGVTDRARLFAGRKRAPLQAAALPASSYCVCGWNCRRRVQGQPLDRQPLPLPRRQRTTGCGRIWNAACVYACAPVLRWHLSLRDAVFLRYQRRNWHSPESCAGRFPRLRLPLPERGTDCPSLRSAADAPETDGCSPLSGSLTCLSIAPRGTIAARGALLIFVEWTLPVPSQFAKFFLHTVQRPAQDRPPRGFHKPFRSFCRTLQIFCQNLLHPPIFCL